MPKTGRGDLLRKTLPKLSRVLDTTKLNNDQNVAPPKEVYLFHFKVLNSLKLGVAWKLVSISMYWNNSSAVKVPDWRFFIKKSSQTVSISFEDKLASVLYLFKKNVMTLLEEDEKAANRSGKYFQFILSTASFRLVHPQNL